MRLYEHNKETKSFKRRTSLGFKKSEIFFGDYALSLRRGFNIEYIHIFNFKRLFKKFYNFKGVLLKKTWAFIHKNYPLTKKSKNARMGKGKGAVARYCFRTVQNHNLFEFKGFSLLDLIKIKKIFNNKLNVPINILNNFFIEKNVKCHKKLFHNGFSKRYRI